VINNVLANGLTSGRRWKEKVVLMGDFEIGNTILISSYTIFDASQIIL